MVSTSARLRPILSAVLSETSTPVLVKIAPDVADSDVDDIADLAVELGLAGIVATNTTVSRDGLVTPDVKELGAGGEPVERLEELHLAGKIDFDGLLDAAEFNNATSDRILGFADVSKVCMLQSYHQNAEQFEISFNKTKFDALPAKMRAIIENAARRLSAVTASAPAP